MKLIYLSVSASQVGFTQGPLLSNTIFKGPHNSQLTKCSTKNVLLTFPLSYENTISECSHAHLKGTVFVCLFIPPYWIFFFHSGIYWIELLEFDRN